MSAAQEDGLTLASATGAGVRNSGSHDVSPGSGSAAAESAAAAGRWAPALARMQAVSRSSATEDSRLTSSGCKSGAGQLLAARASAACGSVCTAGSGASHPRRRHGHQADSGGASATGAARLLLRCRRPRRGLHALAPAELELAAASSPRRYPPRQRWLYLIAAFTDSRSAAPDGAATALWLSRTRRPRLNGRPRTLNASSSFRDNGEFSECYSRLVERAEDDESMTWRWLTFVCVTRRADSPAECTTPLPL